MNELNPEVIRFSELYKILISAKDDIKSIPQLSNSIDIHSTIGEVVSFYIGEELYYIDSNLIITNSLGIKSSILVNNIINNLLKSISKIRLRLFLPKMIDDYGEELNIDISIMLDSYYKPYYLLSLVGADGIAMKSSTTKKKLSNSISAMIASFTEKKLNLEKIKRMSGDLSTSNLSLSNKFKL